MKKDIRYDMVLYHERIFNEANFIRFEDIVLDRVKAGLLDIDNARYFQ